MVAPIIAADYGISIATEPAREVTVTVTRTATSGTATGTVE